MRKIPNKKYKKKKTKKKANSSAILFFSSVSFGKLCFSPFFFRFKLFDMSTQLSKILCYSPFAICKIVAYKCWQFHAVVLEFGNCIDVSLEA